jgi:hypothetical protein
MAYVFNRMWQQWSYSIGQEVNRGDPAHCDIEMQHYLFNPIRYNVPG